MAIDLRPTAEMAAAAKKGLRLREEHGRGGTAVGVARARDISGRRNLSPRTIGRMVNYFARHNSDRDAPGFGNDSDPSNGWIAWLLWGGDPGRAWAKRKYRELHPEKGNARPVQRAAKQTRRQEWARYVRTVQRPAERALLATVRSFLAGQKATVVDRVRLLEWPEPMAVKAWPVVHRDLIADTFTAILLGDSGDPLAGLIDPAMRDAERAGFERVARDLGRSISWDPVLSPSTLPVAENVVAIDGATRADLATLVRRGLAEGWSSNQLQSAIQLDTAGTWSPMRALRIARTEAGIAIGAGTVSAYQSAAQIGVRFKVEWLAAKDAATRPSHLALDGVQVDPGEDFSIPIGKHTGERAAGPGLFRSAAEVVNCRCTTAARVVGV